MEEVSAAVVAAVTSFSVEAACTTAVEVEFVVGVEGLLLSSGSVLLLLLAASRDSVC